MAFRLLCFRSLWGTPSATQLRVTAGAPAHEYADKLLQHVKSQGYDGIEASLSDLRALGGYTAARELLEQHQLKLIAGVYSGWVDYEDDTVAQHFESVSQHLDRYRQQLQELQSAFPGKHAPVWINAHSGADHWRSRDQIEYLAHALELEAQLNVQNLSHETHRGRMFHSPWTTRELLEAFPALKLTLDFSHWCVVSERMLDTPMDEEWLSEVIPHVYHVHGRVGTVQQAQLTHPDAAFSQPAITRFQHLWDNIWTHQLLQFQEAQEADSDASEPTNVRPFATFTPEYGPIPYAPRDAIHPDVEAYDVDEFCREQADRQRTLFADLVNGGG